MGDVAQFAARLSVQHAALVAGRLPPGERSDLAAYEAAVLAAQARMDRASTEYVEASRALAEARLRKLEAEGQGDSAAARWQRAHLNGDSEGCRVALAEQDPGFVARERDELTAALAQVAP